MPRLTPHRWSAAGLQPGARITVDVRTGGGAHKSVQVTLGDLAG
jgi:hypothetical protein